MRLLNPASLWVLLSSIAAMAEATAAGADRRVTQPPAVVNIIELGAVAGGRQLNTDAIQKAIDQVHELGGGTVYVPPGQFLTGTLVLKSNVELYLESGATLLGSANIGDYRPRHVLTARHAENIAILGGGTIDGQGPRFWVKRNELRGFERRLKFSWVPHFAFDHPDRSPGNLIQIEACRHVRIRDVTLKDSESWTLHLLGCEDVVVDGLRIRNPLHGPNTDGIDIEASANVLVSNCDIYTADDAICLKNSDSDYRHLACRNIVVTNCLLTTVCNGFKIGTGTHGDFENIAFSNSVIKCGEPDEPLARVSAATIHPEHQGNALAPLSGIAVETVDGGAVRGVSVSNIVMKGVRAPIFVRLANRGGRGDDKVEKPQPGTLSDVSISGVVAYGASTASSITGIPGRSVEGVTLSDIRIITSGGGTKDLAARQLDELETSYPEATMWGPMPVSGLFCRHVEGLTLRNVEIRTETPDERPLATFDDIAEIRVDGLRGNLRTAADCWLRMKDVVRGIFADVAVPESKGVWVEVSGPKCGPLVLRPEDLGQPTAPRLRVSPEVPAGAVVLRQP